MNTQDFERGEDILRALETAHCAIGGALNNLKQHPQRLRGIDEIRTDALDKMTADRDAVREERDTARWAIEVKDRQLLEHVARLQAVEAERDRYEAAVQPVIDWMRSINTPDVSEFLGQLTALEMRKQLANLEALQPAQKEQK